MNLFPIIDYQNEMAYEAQKLLAEIQYCWSKRLLEHEMDMLPKLPELKTVEQFTILSNPKSKL